MKKAITTLFWVGLTLLGAGLYATIALQRQEPLNSGYILLAAICTYTIGYRFYSRWLAAKALGLEDLRATPCEVREDGKDYVKTNKWIVFGHHFAAISGPGPLVGPVLAAQFGYLPGTLWILIGAVLGGAVQDFVILFCSIRRNGKSLGQMVREEINSTAGAIGLVAILAIMVIILAVLALVVVKALAESPWGIFTVSATIPIAMLMGGYLRYWRPGKVMEASVLGVILLLLAVWGGKFAYADKEGWGRLFTFAAEPLAWSIILYGLAASVLPVWLLLAPRDYLSTFMKLGTIFALAAGCFVVLPELKMPAISRFVDGSGLVVAGKLFPFCFITIACGAISGFHSLIASGVTPKIITREGYARPVGYGAMCLESMVAIMAMIAACTLDPGVYLAINVKGEAAATVAQITSLGFPVTTEQMSGLARQVGEDSLFGRTGGAATLAVGMANIFSQVTHGKWVDLWYHFAIMFEALFILTTLDAGTRVGRYLLQDVLGNLWKPLGDTGNVKANVLASSLMVAGWGYFLIQGVRDPLGGINSLWPLFGIANQMLAAVALCLGTTIILKLQLTKDHPRPPGAQTGPGLMGRPALALVTLVPLVWLLAVTYTAGWQKINDPSPRIGFRAAAQALARQEPALQEAVARAEKNGPGPALEAARKALKANRTVQFNNRLDAVVAAAFLVLVSIILLLSVWEWMLLLTRRKLAQLRESEVVWLPEYAVVENKPFKLLGWLALGIALVRELSGQAAVDRAEAHLQACRRCDPAGRPFQVRLLTPENRPPGERRAEAYVAAAEARFQGVNRCC